MANAPEPPINTIRDLWETLAREVPQAIRALFDDLRERSWLSALVAAVFVALWLAMLPLLCLWSLVGIVRFRFSGK